MDFRVNGVEIGAVGDIQMAAPGTVKVTLKAAAYLAATPNEEIRKLPYDQKPYWTWSVPG